MKVNNALADTIKDLEKIPSRIEILLMKFKDWHNLESDSKSSILYYGLFESVRHEHKNCLHYKL